MAQKAESHEDGIRRSTPYAPASTGMWVVPSHTPLTGAYPKWGFTLFESALPGESACPTSQNQHLVRSGGAGAFDCQHFWRIFPISVKHLRLTGFSTGGA